MQHPQTIPNPGWCPKSPPICSCSAQKKVNKQHLIHPKLDFELCALDGATVLGGVKVQQGEASMVPNIKRPSQQGARLRMTAINAAKEPAGQMVASERDSKLAKSFTTTRTMSKDFFCRICGPMSLALLRAALVGLPVDNVMPNLERCDEGNRSPNELV